MASAEDKLKERIESIGDDYSKCSKSTDYLEKYVSIGLGMADECKSDIPYYASYHYFICSVAFLYYCIENKSTLFLERGRKLLDEAKEIIPGNKEYSLFGIVFETLGTTAPDALQEYDKLKSLNKACPSFRLLENTIFTPEWSEYIFNEAFSYKFIPVVEGLLALRRYDLTEEACALLSSFPAMEAKLKSYTYLSRVLFEERKYDEALRTAKLGVELLGSVVQYDYHNILHNLWAECWTRVGECNRIKKDYDFAMSLFEKGESLGIVSCIHNLGVMYENGESEDKDLKKARELYERARSLTEQRNKEAKEEEERLRRIQLQKKKEEEIAERIRLEKIELAKLKERNQVKKILYVLGIIVCIIIIGSSINNIKDYTILDRANQYYEKGYSILAMEEGKDPNPSYLMVLGDTCIFVDDMHSINSILSVGKPNPVKKIGVYYSSTGVGFVAGLDDYEEPFSYKPELKHFITPIEWGKTYYISPTFNVKDGYIVHSESKGSTVISLFNVVAESDGKYTMSFKGDYTNNFGKRLSSELGAGGLATIKKRNYGYYEFSGYFSPRTLTVDFSSVSFPNIKRSFSAQNMGSEQQYTSFASDCRVLVNGGLTDPYISEIFGVYGTLPSHISNDGKYTFVIKADGNDEHEKMGLFLVNNATKKYSCINHAIEIKFLSDRIYLKKHDTVLLFFNSSKDVYFSYDVR